MVKKREETAHFIPHLPLSDNTLFPPSPLDLYRTPPDVYRSDPLLPDAATKGGTVIGAVAFDRLNSAHEHRQ